MEAIIAYLACVCILLIFGRIFILPIKIIAKLLVNSIVGIFLLYIINWVGVSLNFHIGINWVTIVVCGILGAPRSNIIISFKILSNLEFFLKTESKNKKVRLVKALNQSYFSLILI